MRSTSHRCWVVCIPIQNSEQPFDYYRIMLEFARVPRSVWREVKLRFLKSLDAVQEKKFTQPFRLTFPATDCAFVITPLDPQIPATGPEGEKVRITGLKNLTYAAMYDSKVSKGIGILISKDEEYVQINWNLLSVPWKQDPEMDAKLAKSNPFRPIKEKQIHSFLVATERNQISPSGRALAIVPDATWPGMWRVKLPNDLLAEMVNLTRAKDAAVLLGRIINRSQPDCIVPAASAA
jgi:hypothetical protein